MQADSTTPRLEVRILRDGVVVQRELCRGPRSRDHGGLVPGVWDSQLGRARVGGATWHGEDEQCGDEETDASGQWT